MFGLSQIVQRMALWAHCCFCGLAAGWRDGTATCQCPESSSGWEICCQDFEHDHCHGCYCETMIVMAWICFNYVHCCYCFSSLVFFSMCGQHGSHIFMACMPGCRIMQVLSHYFSPSWKASQAQHVPSRKGHENLLNCRCPVFVQDFQNMEPPHPCIIY